MDASASSKGNNWVCEGTMRCYGIYLRDEFILSMMEVEIRNEVTTSLLKPCHLIYNTVAAERAVL